MTRWRCSPKRSGPRARPSESCRPLPSSGRCGCLWGGWGVGLPVRFLAVTLWIACEFPFPRTVDAGPGAGSDQPASWYHVLRPADRTHRRRACPVPWPDQPDHCLAGIADGPAGAVGTAAGGALRSGAQHCPVSWSDRRGAGAAPVRPQCRVADRHRRPGRCRHRRCRAVVIRFHQTLLSRTHGQGRRLVLAEHGGGRDPRRRADGAGHRSVGPAVECRPGGLGAASGDGAVDLVAAAQSAGGRQ